MPKFYVCIREVHVSHRIVEADTPEQAKELAGDAPEDYLEYSHTLDKEHWTVEEAVPERSTTPNTHKDVGGDIYDG